MIRYSSDLHCVGEAVIKNEWTGETHKITPGSLLWIPAGAKVSLVSSKGCGTVFVEAGSMSPDEEGTNGKPSETQQSKLDELIADFISQNPGSKKAIDRARQGIPGGTTRAVLESDPFPLVAKSGRGATLTSVDDRTYVDFQSDFTAALFGHSHPDLQQAIAQTARNGFSLGAVTELEGQLSESLRERFPSIDQVRFCNSGTEANTFAIAAGLAYSGRQKVLVFDHGYHGGTLSFGTLPNALNLPHDFIVGVYDSIEKTQPLLSGDIGVIIVEPMQSAGGLRPASRDFMQFLRRAADTLGAVLIFDEVVTSRLDYHGLQGTLGIRPDMTTLGKYIGGGLPFGAFGGKADIMVQFDPRSNAPTKLAHSGTFNNNVFTMNAAIAASKLVSKEAIERINGLGDRFRRGVKDALAKADKAAAVVLLGVGSCVGLHFPGTDGNILREILFFHLLSRGFWIGRRGFLALNFAHTEADVDAVVAGFAEFLDLYA